MKREHAWALVPQDPDFAHLQGMSTPVLQCLSESLAHAMGATDPLRTVIEGILATRDANAPVEMIDMMGNRMRVSAARETSMRRDVMIATARAEHAASDWWAKMTSHEKEAYRRAHPQSKYARQGTAPHEHRYDQKSVNDAIRASNRSGKRIGGKEAKTIHALLKGRG